MTTIARNILAAFSLYLFIAPNAMAVSFSLDFDRSFVRITDQSGGGFACAISSCGIEASLAPSLETEPDFTLTTGETNTFDFIEFSGDGTTNIFGRAFDIRARLFFDEPVAGGVVSNGDGRGFLFGGIITGGILTWTEVPRTVTLPDGSVVTVDFQDGITILPLSETVLTTASVTVDVDAAVPLPAPLLLLLSGMAALGVTRLRRAA